jgi:uncharacterized delta-60 repeat protein
MFRFTRNTLGRSAALIVLAAGILLPSVSAQSASRDFDPNVNGNVLAMVRQADGKIVAAGDFWLVNPNDVGDAANLGRIARFNPDGTIDPTLWADFDGEVSSLVLLPDGGFVAAGKFTSVRSNTDPSTPVARAGLARLLPDGRLDLAWDPNPQGNAFPQALVRTLAVQADGSVLVGGAFTGFQPGKAGEIIARNRLARILPDGTVDAAFDPNPNGLVLALALQADGRILAGGAFTSLAPGGGATVAMARLARLNADGTVDTTFRAEPDNRVLALEIGADGSVLVGGDFLRVTFAGGATPTAIPHLFKVSAAGVYDSAFDPIPNAPVDTIAFEADGRILLGGRFTNIFSRTSRATVARTYLARLLPDGKLDTSFSTFPTAAVRAFVVEPDGSIVLGGLFTRVQGVGSTAAAPRRRIARLQPNGSLDTVFKVDLGGTISAAVVLEDGSTIYAGSLTSVGGVTRSAIAKVSASGALDLGFAPEFNGTINDVVLQSDGKIVVGGTFTKIGTVDRQYLARLNADGSVDTAYDPKANAAVSDLALQSDGKVLVSGSFTTFTPNGATEATTRNFIARINTDGTVDSAFNPSAGSAVNAMAVQSDGKILIGGQFTSLRPNATGDAISRTYLARLNADGTVDTAFNISLNSGVSALALQSDGKVLVGGLFTAMLQVGATEPTSRNFIARLNADATIDTAFDPKPNSTVTEIAVLSDGRIAIGGTFTTLAPNGATEAISRRYFAWLEANGTAPEARAFQFNSTVTLVAPTPSGLLVGGVFNRMTLPPDGTGVAIDDQLVRFTSAGAFDSSFELADVSAAGGYVGAIAIQSNGRMIVGGSFDGLAGSLNRNLSRVDADGFADSNFFAKPDGPVNSVLVLPQSEDYEAVGGPFGWLAAAGGLNPAFDHTNAAALVGSVSAIARQSDGKIIVGGLFSAPSGVGANLVRFNADGSFDTTFAPNPDARVTAIGVQSDGKIVIGGDFTKVGSVTRNRLARINTDGTLDTGFDPNANAAVSRIHVLSDDKILVAGTFTGFTPSGATTSITRTYVARLNTAGTVDTDFTASPNGAVSAIAVQSDGKVLIGGSFTSVGDASRPYMARLNANGTLDTTFTGRANNVVYAIKILTDGKFLVGGAFTTIQNNADATAVARTYLARLNTDGTLDTAFNSGIGGLVTAVELQSDGRILVGGTFTFLLPDPNADPIFRSYLARLNADGTIDPSFNPIPDGTIAAISVFPDGTFGVGGGHKVLFPEALVYVGGAFQNFSEAPVAHLARLFNNGLVDVTLPARPNGEVFGLALQADRSIVFGGAFTEVSGTPRGGLARLTPAGELDTAFNPDTDGTVTTVVALPDGRTIVGGDFTTIGGTPRQRIAIVDAAGVVDASFVAQLDAPAHAIVQQGDGSFVVAGAFTTVNGTARPYLARLLPDGSLDASYAPAPDALVSTISLQGDGGAIVGGAFTQIGGLARRGLARVTVDGTVDPAYVADTNGDVHAVAAQYNGAVVVGGGFSSIAGDARRLVARLTRSSAGSRVITISPDLGSATLEIGGSAGDLSSTEFFFSTDAATWTSLGAGQRTGEPGEWRITGAAFPAASIYYVRVDGRIATSRFGSGGSFTTEAQFFGATPALSFAPVGDDSDPGAGSGSDGSDGSGSPSGPGGPGSGGGADGGTPGSGGSDTDSDAQLPGGGAGPGASFGVINLSGRGYPLGEEPLIAGFVVAGAGEQQILLRAVGPGLRVHGVSDVLEQPTLRLFDGAGAFVGAATDWTTDASIPAAADTVGAFPLDPTDGDAAALVTLQPGVYTAHLVDRFGLGGVALGEVYLVPGANPGVLSNVSLRGPVGAGDSVLVAGFVVPAGEERTVLVRGVGPTLAAYGVTDATSDPAIRVFDTAGALVAENDDWAVQSDGSAQAVAAAMTSANAFSLPADGRDAALLVTLPAGIYTIQLSARELGTALIEVYAVP